MAYINLIPTPIQNIFFLNYLNNNIMLTQNFQNLIQLVTGRDFIIDTTDNEIFFEKQYEIIRVLPASKRAVGFSWKTPKSDEKMLRSFITAFTSKYREPNPANYKTCAPYFSPSWDQMTIEKAMYIAKTEGMALGIITLFQQDLIKKPAEQVVNVERLGLETSNIKQLDTIEASIALGLSEEKMVNVLSKYIRGDKSPLYAHLIQDCDDFDDKEYATSEKIKEKLISFKACSGEEVLSILSSDLLENIKSAGESIELVGNNE